MVAPAILVFENTRPIGLKSATKSHAWAECTHEKCWLKGGLSTGLFAEGLLEIFGVGLCVFVAEPFFAMHHGTVDI